jgi:hypothetical protein
LKKQWVIFFASILALGLVSVTTTYASPHEGDHGGGICASDHGALSGQVAQTSLLAPFKQPVWSGNASVINMAAITKPFRSPVTLLYLNGKIVPASAQQIPSTDKPDSAK